MTVISLAKARDERQPYWSGKVRCVSCRHEWAGVAPIGTEWLECPSCGLMRGHAYHPFGASSGESLFVCNCGSEALTAYFHKGTFRMQCMSCGVDHSHAIYGEAP